MFDHKHYVPILKTKGGEAWALFNLDGKLRKQMTPVLEIHKPKKKKDVPAKPLIEHIHKVCDTIKENWGTMYPFFLDTEWVNSQHGTTLALTTAIEACRTRGLKPIPVVRIDYDEPALDVVKAATEKDGRGYMLRLDFEDANASAAVRVVDYLGLKRAGAHLLLDYRENAMNLSEDVQKLPSLNEWMTFTASSSAFPKRISALPRRMWLDMPRHDWSTWEQSVTKDHLSRKPTFSDYATRCAGPPADGSRLRVSRALLIS